MSDFAKISELVTKGQQLLDSIKGGAIRTMQTQFDALKVQLNDVINGANGRLNTFITQQQQNVSTIFADPDKRYQTHMSKNENAIRLDLTHLDSDKFYCVAIHQPEMLDVRIRRYLNDNGNGTGILDFYFQIQNWSAGGDFTFCKQFHHYFNGKNWVGKIKANISNYYSGVWLRGGVSYSVYISGNKNKGSDLRVIESDSDVVESVGGLVFHAAPITQVDSSVVPNNYIAGV